jgi:hypothetical protein
MIPPQSMKERIITGTKMIGVSKDDCGTTVIALGGQRMAAGIAQARAIASDFQKKTAAHPMPLSSRNAAPTTAVQTANLAGVFISLLSQND